MSCESDENWHLAITAGGSCEPFIFGSKWKEHLSTVEPPCQPHNGLAILQDNPVVLMTAS